MAQAILERAPSAADRRRNHDVELIGRLVGGRICGVCCTQFASEAALVLHLAADRVEAIAELGGPVGVRIRNAARRVRDAELAEENDRLTARAWREGYGQEAEAYVAGYRRNRTSDAITSPGPRRSAFAAGWIARQLDRRKLQHEANLDGQHDELEDRSECGACTHVGEAELRALWGDR